MMRHIYRLDAACFMLLLLVACGEERGGRGIGHATSPYRSATATASLGLSFDLVYIPSAPSATTVPTTANNPTAAYVVLRNVGKAPVDFGALELSLRTATTASSQKPQASVLLASSQVPEITGLLQPGSTVALHASPALQAMWTSLTPRQGALAITDKDFFVHAYAAWHLAGADTAPDSMNTLTLAAQQSGAPAAAASATVIQTATSPNGWVLFKADPAATTLQVTP